MARHPRLSQGGIAIVVFGAGAVGSGLWLIRTEYARRKYRLDFVTISIGYGLGLARKSKRGGLPMRLILFSLVVMAWSMGPIAGPRPPAPAQKANVSDHVDFDALRAQASRALERLRQSHENRVAMASAF